jgi:tetratricopeptide (TPR) repeat protein
MSTRKHALEVQFQNGARLHAAGRLHEAEQVYRQVLAAAPNHADSLHLLGVVALQSGHPQPALTYIDQAIALRPTTAAYHVNRANALLALRQIDAAIAAAREALRLKRSSAEAHMTLGHALSDAGQLDAAIAAYQEALRLQPGMVDAQIGLALTLRLADRLEDAAAALQRGVDRAPADMHARSNLGGVLKELGRLDEAEAQYRAALSRHPQDALLHFNLAMVLLLKGDFAAGWQEYRWRPARLQLPPLSQPEWDGAPLAGRRLFVRAEQGLGSAIQFCRYVSVAAERGDVVMEVQPGLQRLLSSLNVPIVTAGEPPPQFDVWCAMQSLPLLLGAEPPPPPYLTPETDCVARWRERIGSHGRKIGITWQGNPTASAERGRSIPLTAFAPLARIPGVRLISLQKHNGLQQVAQAGDLPVETLGDDFDAGADAFVDTAAVMQSLDLVISSDTSIAHLAGALARPTWVALQHVPDWRWMLERTDSPWYPTMRLFRQQTRGDWDGVFAAMAQELAA